MMNEDLMDAFWRLGTDKAYKGEVFSILKQCFALDADQLLSLMLRIE